MNLTATDFYRVNEARFLSQEDIKAVVYLTILKRYHDGAQRSMWMPTQRLSEITAHMWISVAATSPRTQGCDAVWP